MVNKRTILFLNAEANFLIREENKWYREPASTSASSTSASNFSESVD